ATDNVGHVEAKLASAETQTVIGTNPWRNAENTFDVDHDGFIAPADALAIINSINAFGSRKLPSTRGASEPFLDRNGDGFVAPNDALDVINTINAGQSGEGESNQATDPDSQQQAIAGELLALLATDI